MLSSEMCTRTTNFQVSMGAAWVEREIVLSSSLVFFWDTLQPFKHPGAFNLHLVWIVKQGGTSYHGLKWSSLRFKKYYYEHVFNLPCVKLGAWAP